MGYGEDRAYYEPVSADPVVGADAAGLAPGRLSEQEGTPDEIRARMEDANARDLHARQQEQVDLAGRAGAVSVHPVIRAAGGDVPAGDEPGAPQAAQDVERPAGNASTADWRAFAAADPGYPGDAAEDSRDEIRGYYEA